MNCVRLAFKQVSANLVTLQTCLAAMMGRPLTLDQLRQDVGLMVERITNVTMMLQRSQLRMEEYVCLKVIAMLGQRKNRHSFSSYTLLYAIVDGFSFILLFLLSCSERKRQRRARGHPGALYAMFTELRGAQLSAVARQVL